MKEKTAIILGATGLVGGLLLDKLLDDKNYKTIKLFSRKSVNIQNPKVEEYLWDIIHLENFKEDFTADEVFCCIGTTKSKTKDKQLYKDIDYGIPKIASQLTKENNIPFFAVISALGADSSSNFFYNKTKGDMEEAVLNQDIKNTYILRPSLIYGNRTEKRFSEDIGNSIFKFLNPIFKGKLEKYAPIDANDIASALYKLPSLKVKNSIILSDKIKHIAKNI